MSAPTRLGGVVVKHGDGLRFLPASVVMGIMSCPPISRVPGAPASLLGIVHTAGQIVPVVALDAAVGGRPKTTLLVCRYRGEPVGLLGCNVVGAGTFDADETTEGAVVVGGVPAPALDLAVTFASLQSARWLALGGIDG